MPWESLRAVSADEEEIDPGDASVLEFIECDKQNGIRVTTLREVRASVGAQREQWRLAMQAEVQNLVDNRTFEEVGKDELKAINHRDILPMKLATGTKRDALAGTEKKKVRAVVCCNFQRFHIIYEITIKSLPLHSHSLFPAYKTKEVIR